MVVRQVDLAASARQAVVDVLREALAGTVALQHDMLRERAEED